MSDAAPVNQVWTTALCETPCPEWTDVLIDLRTSSTRTADIPTSLDEFQDPVGVAVAQGAGWDLRLFTMPHKPSNPTKHGNDTYALFTTPDHIRFAVAVNKKGTGHTPARLHVADVVKAVSSPLRGKKIWAIEARDSEPPVDRPVLPGLEALYAAVCDPTAWLSRAIPEAGFETVSDIRRPHALTLLLLSPAFAADEVVRLVEARVPPERAWAWRKDEVPLDDIIDWAPYLDSPSLRGYWVGAGFTAATAREWLPVTTHPGFVTEWTQAGFTSATAAEWAPAKADLGMRMTVAFRDAGWTADDTAALTMAALRLHSARGGWRSYTFQDEDYQKLLAAGTLDAAVASLPAVYEQIRERSRIKHAAREAARQARATAASPAPATVPPTVQVTPVPSVATPPVAEGRGHVVAEDERWEGRWEGRWAGHEHSPAPTQTAPPPPAVSPAEHESVFAAAVADANRARSSWTPDDAVVAAALHAAQTTQFINDAAKYWAVYCAANPEATANIPTEGLSLSTLTEWARGGFTLDDLDYCYRATLNRQGLPPEAFWRYMRTVGDNRLRSKA